MIATKCEIVAKFKHRNLDCDTKSSIGSNDAEYVQLSEYVEFLMQYEFIAKQDHLEVEEHFWVEVDGPFLVSSFFMRLDIVFMRSTLGRPFHELRHSGHDGPSSEPRRATYQRWTQLQKTMRYHENSSQRTYSAHPRIWRHLVHPCGLTGGFEHIVQSPHVASLKLRWKFFLEITERSLTARSVSRSAVVALVAVALDTRHHCATVPALGCTLLNLHRTYPAGCGFRHDVAVHPHRQICHLHLIQSGCFLRHSRRLRSLDHFQNPKQLAHFGWEWCLKLFESSLRWWTVIVVDHVDHDLFDVVLVWLSHDLYRKMEQQ